jgi:hypothetical protein
MPPHEQGCWIPTDVMAVGAPSPWRLGKDLVVDGRLAVIEQSRVHFAVLWHFNGNVWKPSTASNSRSVFEISFLKNVFIVRTNNQSGLTAVPGSMVKVQGKINSKSTSGILETSKRFRVCKNREGQTVATEGRATHSLKHGPPLGGRA